MSALTDARTPAASPRAERVVDLSDRGFPLLWILLYLLLPVSGWAEETFRSWFDQQRDLEALRSVLADGRADAIADNVIGPGYIASAAVVHWITGLGAQDALVAMNRASYALSVAVALVLVRILVRRLVAAPPMTSLAAQFVLVGLVFSAGTWHWSDVPWSHFFAAFLAVSLYAARYVPSRIGLASAALTGGVLALLALTRSFEMLSLVLAWAIVLGILTALRLTGPRQLRTSHVISGVGGFVTVTAAVHAVTGKRDLFFLYGNHLDHQSGAVRPAEIADTPTFSLGFVPTKLVQLFYEPCHYSMCSLSDYAGGATTGGPLDDAAGNDLLWRLPLSVQLPSLVLLPLCVLALAGVVVWAVRHRDAVSTRIREIRLLLEMTIAATGIVVGYAASTMTGSSHLRYGFARDFLLPALLAAIVSVSLLSIGIWLLVHRAGSVRIPPTSVRLSGETVVVLIAFVLAAGLVGATAAARASGLPRLESRLGPVEYTASCTGDECTVRVEAHTVFGKPISIPEPSTLTFGCGTDRPRYTVYVESLSAPVPVEPSCSDPRLVAAWPTVMGLPPGSYELDAVAVRNVGG